MIENGRMRYFFKNNPGYRLALATVLCSGCIHFNVNTDDRELISPYELSTYRPGPGGEEYTYTFKGCPEAPKAIHDFDLQDFYSDPPVYSKVDPQRQAEFNAKKKLFVDYSKLVWAAANSYLLTQNALAADCAMHLLKVWAKADAMLGRLSGDPKDKMGMFQGLITREWILGQLANSFLKIRDAKSLNARDKEIVVDWFRRMATASPKFFDEHPKLVTNNLMTWAGATSAIVAVALNDRELLDFAIRTFKATVDQIQDDGTLPQELARNEQALHYHNFALTPLAIISYFSAPNDIDPWGYKSERVNKLVALMTSALQSPDVFQKLTGTKQNLEFVGDDAGWTEFVFRKSREPLLKSYLTTHRPIREYWFDWDVTAAFGDQFGSKERTLTQ